jgi:hypothetical protein
MLDWTACTATPSILASAVPLPSLAGGSVPLVTSLRPDEPLTSISHAVSGGSLVGAVHSSGRYRYLWSAVS